MHSTSELFDILAGISFHGYPTVALFMHLFNAVHNHGLLFFLLVDDIIVKALQAAEKLRFYVRLVLLQVKVRSFLFFAYLFFLPVKPVIRRALIHFALGMLLDLSGL